MSTTLKDVLYERVAEGDHALWEPIDKQRLRCYACGHQCPIAEGQAGVCKVRFNQGGKLLVPWGYVGGVQCDPVEKKPYFHVYPGSLAYSFGMLGCDLHCAYCQNWVTSQALRDPDAISPPMQASPEAIADDAVRQGAKIVVSTYNEPLITSEWAVAIFKEARARGLKTGFVSNGNGTRQVLDFLAPHIDFYKVDLKSFNEQHYHQLGGRLQPILDTIRSLHERGIWLEIVTLIFPGFNDSDAELRQAAEFLAGVSPMIPWHVTAFHSDYKMETTPSTPVKTLLRAAEIGKEAGLKYIYAGNQPGKVGELENTRCHACNALLVERYGYLITGYHLTPEGKCPQCATAIPGRWGKQFDGQIASTPFLPRFKRNSLISLS